MNIIKKFLYKVLILFFLLGYPGVLFLFNKCSVKQTNKEWLGLWRAFD